jgi:hypothetical protein
VAVTFAPKRVALATTFCKSVVLSGPYFCTKAAPARAAFPTCILAHSKDPREAVQARRRSKKVATTANSIAATPSLARQIRFAFPNDDRRVMLPLPLIPRA